MLFAFLALGVAGKLLSPIDENGGTGGAAGGGVDLGQANAQTAPFAVFPDEKSFKDRLARSTRAELRSQFGTDDIELIKARMARAKELEDAEEQRKKEAMTEAERLRAEKAQAEASAKTAADLLAQERAERLVATECAQRGIKDVTYASFLVAQKTEALADGEQLDVGAFLDEQLKDAKRKVALGIEDPPPPPTTTVQDPATTVPKPLVAPPAPPAPGAGNQPPDAMSMSNDQWQAHRRGLGL